jgi:hypothetical protein
MSVTGKPRKKKTTHEIVSFILPNAVTNGGIYVSRSIGDVPFSDCFMSVSLHVLAS